MASQAQFPFNQPIVWQPSEEVVRRSRLKRFMDRHDLATFEELMARSTISNLPDSENWKGEQ